MGPPILTLPTRFRDVRDGVLLVEFPEASDDEANRAAIWLGKSLAASATEGFRDAIPAARTLLVLFDPGRLARDRVLEEVSRSASNRGGGGEDPRLVRIAVAYGGDAALDLAELARGAALSEEEFVRRHAAAEYRVAFIGFAPGFAYLLGLPPELRAARLLSPRPRVVPGALGIGGPYTGIYPAAMPGGWRLIGRTSASLFDSEAKRPALLAPGDLVRFDRIRADELAAPSPPARPRPPRGRAVFRVAAAGLFATIQGAPRYGLGSSGVPPGGAMDLRSLARANSLLGNAAGDPGLEIALAGPELEALEEVEVAVAGADFQAELDGRPAPSGRAFRVPAGSRLRFPRARRGARVYLAVSGGFVETCRPGESSRRIETGEELASRSAPSVCGRVRDPGELAPAGRTSLSGRPAPRTLPFEARPSLRSAPASTRRFLAAIGPADEAAFPRRVLRVIPGPQSDHFSAAAMDRLLSIPWRVTPASDRRGLRLEGELLEHVRAPEIPPEGTVPGSIQVPGNGSPIVLGPDGPVTGGYPKIATVIEADLAFLGQAAPGDVLRFRAVTLEEAAEARREYH